MLEFYSIEKGIASTSSFRGKQWTPEALALEAVVAKELRSHSHKEMDAIYNSISHSHNGTHYGTDIAKWMFSGAYSSQLNNVATGPSAHAYVTDRFKRDMANSKNGNRRRVVFTAGGPGSGKSGSFSSKNNNCGDIDNDNTLVFDSTFSDLDTARELMGAALQDGRSVQVVYMHCPVELAMQRACLRAGRTGHYVDPTQLGEMHYKAQNTLLALAQEYSGEPAVEFVVFDNSRGKEETTRLQDGVRFFASVENSTERYLDMETAVRRAVDADGGEMARQTRLYNNSLVKAGLSEGECVTGIRMEVGRETGAETNTPSVTSV